MRVMIAAGNYPQLSETYISTEVDYFIRAGVQIAVHAPKCFTGKAHQQATVYRGSLRTALGEFKPDVLHSHYMHYTLERLQGLVGVEIPITVRAHSYDFSQEDAAKLQAEDRVRKIYAFPHFALELSRFSKVTPLPVAYNSEAYPGYMGKDKRLVLRLAAGKSTKGLDDFFSVAELCPEYTFVLGLADMGQDVEFFQQLAARKNRGGMVRMMRNVPWPEARALTALAGVYLDTSDPAGHRFGMPISIAESMATGSFVLARSAVGLREYLNGSGSIYETPQQAAGLLNRMLTWNDDQWQEKISSALGSAAAYRDDVVLRRIHDDWELIVKAGW